MSKYIDADEAIKALCRNSFPDFSKAVKIIKELPGTDAAPRWIPVTDRLPDINDHYTSDVCLVYCDNGAYTFAELEENIFAQVGWDCEREDDYHEAVGTVVAWMLLPAPYKSGEEE